MAAPSKHERLVECLRDRLATYTAALGAWYPPDRVEPVTEWDDNWLPEASYNTALFIHSGPERVVEQPSKHYDLEAEINVIGCRRLAATWTNPFDMPREVVAPAPWANGALTIAAQPVEPSVLLVRVRDDDIGISAGTVSLVGLDPTGAAITATFDVAAGRERVIAGRLADGRMGGPWASVTSATVAGAVGAGAGDTVAISAGPTRKAIGDRMVKDILERVGSANHLADCVDGMQNVEIFDIDRDLKHERYAVVKVGLLIKYRARVGQL